MTRSPVFSMEIIASPDDVDVQGHVSNIRYVAWIQDVAAAHSVAVGFDLAAYRALDSMFVVRRHEIDYLLPTYQGDRVRLSTWVETFKPASSVRMTEILRLGQPGEGGPESDVVVARGKTTWVFVGRSTGRVRRIPEHVREAFRQEPGPLATDEH